jgi:uncharacterized protein (TIGR02246 family)
MRRLARYWRNIAAVSAILAGAACAPDLPEPAARRLADREAVEATMQRYLRGLDRLDRELYAGSFAPDGVLDIDGNGRSGRDAMRGVIDQEIAFRKDMQDRGATPRVLFHMETNVHITFPEADRATRTAYWVTYVREGVDPEGLSALGVGTSVDELQRFGDEWLITRRLISLQP